MDFVLSLKALTIIVMVLLFLFICLITTLVVFLLKLKGFKNRYTKVLEKFDNKSLEKDIETLLAKLEEVEHISGKTKIISESAEGKVAKCIQKIGIVKYDAYNSGSNKLSFSLALLDSSNTGVLLNSIYTREGSNIYAKEILAGKYAGELSIEEAEALSKTMKYSSFM